VNDDDKEIAGVYLNYITTSHPRDKHRELPENIECVANAEFIVRACNAHDELLKVCQEMMGVLEAIDFCELSADYDSIPFAEWEAAIAKARGDK